MTAFLSIFSLGKLIDKTAILISNAILTKLLISFLFSLSSATFNIFSKNTRSFNNRMLLNESQSTTAYWSNFSNNFLSFVSNSKVGNLF